LIIKNNNERKTMVATKLIVTATEKDSGLLEEFTYEFPVYEFEDGLILVIGEDTHDWFFEDRESIEANGCAQVIDVAESSETIDWSLEDLQEAIEGSLSEFWKVPKKALDLLCPTALSTSTNPKN